MRVIGAPHQIIDADHVAGEDGGFVVFDGGVKLPTPNFAGSCTHFWAPVKAVFPRQALVHSIEPVRDPSTVKLAHHKVELWVLLRDAPAHQLHQGALYCGGGGAV